MTTNKVVVSDDTITEFQKYCIELAPTLEIDADGYVITKEDGAVVRMGVNGDNKDQVIMLPLVVYKGVIKDPESIVINPFIEGISKNASGDWFVDMLTATASNYVRMIQKALLCHALESQKQDAANKVKKVTTKTKTKVVTEESPVSPKDLQLAGIIAKWVEKIDDTTLLEYDALTKKMSNYFAITYFRKSHEARVTCGLFNDDFKVAHKKVRQKTWDVVLDMIKHIFNTTDFSEYVAKSEISSCPRLDSILKLLLKIYTALNPYMKYLPEELQNELKHKTVDLNFLSSNIDLLDVFRSKVAHISTTTPVAAAAMANKTVSLNPVANALRNSGIKVSDINVMGNRQNVVRPLGAPDPTNIPKPSSFGIFTASMTMGCNVPSTNNDNLTNGW